MKRPPSRTRLKLRRIQDSLEASCGPDMTHLKLTDPHSRPALMAGLLMVTSTALMWLSLSVISDIQPQGPQMTPAVMAPAVVMPGGRQQER